MRFSRRALVLSAAVGLTGCASYSDQAPTESPGWSTEVVAEDLNNPWDVVQAPDQALIFTEKGGALRVVRDDNVQEIAADLSDVAAQGEGGLMGLTLDPAYADNRRFYTCQSTAADVRVVAWEMAKDYSSAQRDPQPLVSGITAAGSGRHSGCRLRFDDTGALLVATGDAAIGTNPQDLTSLNGKVLRVDPQKGSPAEGNPYADDPDPATALILTSGHRNVQGLAVQPGTGQIFGVEQGPDRDDEINIIIPGANYGWNPVGDGSYDEDVPMSDPDLGPDVQQAFWSTGTPTLAMSGAEFIDGSEWGDSDGDLLVACLKAQRLLLVEVNDDDTVGNVSTVDELDGNYGRLRSVTMGVDGSVYVTSSNGSGDVIVRITP